MTATMTTGRIAIVCIFLLMVGVLFWPTLYRYERVSESTGGVTSTSLLRIQRLTGHTERYVGGRWVAPTLPAVPEPLPTTEWSKVTGNARLKDGVLEGEIYNGSRWTVARVNVRVAAKTVPQDRRIAYLLNELSLPPNPTNPVFESGSKEAKDPQVSWVRTFAMDVYVPPLSTSLFHIVVTSREYVGLFAEAWRIEEALGYPSKP